VVGRGAALMKGDLHARDAGPAPDLFHHLVRRVAIEWSLAAEQHDAVAVASVAGVEVPHAPVLEPHQGIDPTGAIEGGPPAAPARVPLDHRPADGLEVEHAGVVGQMTANPRAAPLLDVLLRRRLYGPEIERPAASGLAGDVAPPLRRAVDDRDVAAHMAAFEQRHPHMAGTVVPFVLLLRTDDAAADAHALQIDHGLGKHRKMRRRRAVRAGREPLVVRDGDLVVDPALVRVPHPGVEIFRGDDDVRRAFDAAEILQPPRIGFTDRHSAPRNAGWAKASRAHARDLARNAW